MPSYLVAGASRGIGYGLVKVLSANKDNTVIGLVRNVPAAKTKFAADFPDRTNIHIFKGDLNDRKTIEEAVKEVSALTGGSLDVLISNAGIGAGDFQTIGAHAGLKPESFEADFDRVMRTNVVGTIYVLALFAPLLEKGTLKKAVVISSAMGDVEWTNATGSSFESVYSMSKAAVNVAVAKFNVEYRDRGVLFFGISPGLVATEFGRDVSADAPTPSEAEQAAAAEGFAAIVTKFKEYDPSWRGTPLTADESATLVADTIDKATLKKDGGIMVSQYGNTTKWF